MRMGSLWNQVELLPPCVRPSASRRSSKPIQPAEGILSLVDHREDRDEARPRQDNYREGEASREGSPGPGADFSIAKRVVGDGIQRDFDSGQKGDTQPRLSGLVPPESHIQVEFGFRPKPDPIRAHAREPEP